MGQKNNLQQTPTLISFSMCDHSRTVDMPSVATGDSEQIVTVHLLNNNEDVDLLKAQLNGIPLSSVEGNGVESEECHSSLISESPCEHNASIQTDKSSATTGESSTCISETSDISDSLCQSTETLIDQIQLSDSVCNTGAGCSKLGNSELIVSEVKARTQSLPVTYSAACNGDTSTIVTSIHSGLLISSGSLTQDMPVNMASDNKRMSSVLESLDLQLLYLPTTKQLVAAKRPQTIDSSGINSKSGINYCNSDSSGVICTDNSPVKEFNDSDTLTTPTKTSNHISQMQSGTILTPGSLDDSSSIHGICETDFLIKIKEPDQLTCDSSEYECNFPRINTNESLLRTFTDASSLSSISTSTDFSVSAASLDDGEGTGFCIDTGDAGFMEISLHSRNSFERTKNPSQDSGFEDRSTKPKRKGLSGFLSRNIFSRKSKEPNSDSEESDQGWKLFGKVPPKLIPTKDPEQVLSEYQAKQRSEKVATRTKKEDIEVMSTTALILENRPMNLPSKDPDEEEKHKLQYTAMVEAAKRKEQKEMKLKKKAKQQQLRQEDQLLAQAKMWTKDILPHWDTMKNSKKARDLWWHGIPTNIRGRVWKLAFGNDLNITQELYEICVTRAEDKIKQMDEYPEIFGTSDTSSVHSTHSKESSVELIKLDVSRTFPQLCIFQKGGPLHDLLHSLLGAYACYRPDVGYVQGMSFISAVLLLNMEASDAFICFSNLLNNPCQVAFFRVDESSMKSYFITYEEFFVHNMPCLQKHFARNNLTPDLYLYDWIFTLFTKAFPLDLACHIWDVFCRDGEEFLFRAALGILKLFEEVFMTMDFIHLAQLLTRLPDNISEQTLFKCIESIHMTIDKRKFAQVLASHRDSKDNT